MFIFKMLLFSQREENSKRADTFIVQTNETGMTDTGNCYGT